MLKKVLKLFAYITATVGLLILVYMLGALIGSLLPVSGKASSSPKTKQLYMSSNGVHLSFILPTGHLSEKIMKQVLTNRQTQFLDFGWGDKEFYTKTPEWADLRAGVALRATFLLGPAAMHVGEHATKRETWFLIKINDEQLNILLRYLENTFDQDAAGNYIRVPAEHYGPNHTFYEAAGSYTLFKTCNEWVNQGLKEMGIKTSVWSPFDKGVLYHLE